MGDGYASYQKTSHPVRLYVMIVGVIGVLLVSLAIHGYLRLWRLITIA